MHSTTRNARPGRWLGHLADVVILGTALAGSAPAALAAQTISPPIAEYQERARASFQLTNTTLFPLNVVLEVRGFRIGEQGDLVDVPLDTGRVHVKLSTMSFRIAPRATYNVFYEAKADSAPAWFNILAAMTGARTDTGLNLRIILPHVVYLDQKRPLAREAVVLRAFQVDSAAGRARVELENTGPALGRVLSVTASNAGGQSVPAAGFPLLPHSRRWSEVGWAGTAAPTRLVVRFAKFTIDTVLTAVVAPGGSAGSPLLAADSSPTPAR
jgi:hypothetical protein